MVYGSMSLGLGFRVGSMFVNIFKRFARSLTSSLRIYWLWEDVGEFQGARMWAQGYGWELWAGVVGENL
jgi:hypothetical protein